MKTSIWLAICIIGLVVVHFTIPRELDYVCFTILASALAIVLAIEKTHKDEK